jgi:hypothetical protein
MEGGEEDRKLGRDGQDTESAWHGCTSSRTPPGFHLLQGGDLWAGGLRVERRAEAARLLSDYRSEGGRVASSV